MSECTCVSYRGVSEIKLDVFGDCPLKAVHIIKQINVLVIKVRKKYQWIFSCFDEQCSI